MRGFNKAAAILTVVAGPAVSPPQAVAAEKNPTRMELPYDQMRLDKMVQEIEKSPVHTYGPEGFSQADLKCLADNVYHEARGEGVQGKYAVIFSTLSRVLDKKYPKTICGVVHQPWQFSWTKDEKILAQPINPKVYAQVASQVLELMKGRATDDAAILSGMHAGLPHGAIFYKRVGFQGSERVQKFFSSLQPVGTVGHHEFFVRKK